MLINPKNAMILGIQFFSAKVKGNDLHGIPSFLVGIDPTMVLISTIKIQ